MLIRPILVTDGVIFDTVNRDDENFGSLCMIVEVISEAGVLN